MSNFSHQYQYQEQQHIFGDPDAYFMFPGSKTPTESLVNHTGLSPGPLTTPPPSSRNHSQPPEPVHDHLQQPDYMLYDNGSPSNSPTSVRTPDNDSFEVDMLDSEMRTFYQNGGAMSTQGASNGLQAMDSSMFFNQNYISTQDMDEALSATVAAHQHTYQMSYDISHQQLPHISTMPQHAQHYQQHYNAQTHTAPWTGQGPARSPIAPQSGMVVFDPQSDPNPNYANHHQLHYENYVDNWAHTSTDPSNLMSPNERALPPQENAFFMPYRPHHHIPQLPLQTQSLAETKPRRASPSPDEQNFVNYNASSALFTDNYTTGHQYPTSPATSSISQYPQSAHDRDISPSAVSPGSSEGMFSSYSHSYNEMIMDPNSMPHFDAFLPQHPSVMEMEFQPASHIPELQIEPSPEPEAARKNSTAKSLLKSSGGRALGTHLEPTVAKAANDMRKIVACWHCVLQRDKCGPGDVCERCFKRSQRPNADCGLGCSRIKLADLTQFFLPGLVTQMHEQAALTQFVSSYIRSWGNQELTVWMTCGQAGMPRIPVKVYEFEPIGNDLLVQIQYKTDKTTLKRITLKKQSPALGMVQVNHNEEKNYDKYINDIVEHYLDAFGVLCWMEDDNDFQQRLFKLMTRVKPKSDDEAKLLREVYRLIVVTFIMSHALTIAEESKHSTLQRMHSYGGPNHYADNFTTPRMTNRQLKYFFARLQRNIQNTVLNKLQQIFKSSKGCDKWLAAFVAVLGLCMALEDEQKMIHQVMSTKAITEGLDPRDTQDEANEACRKIDEQVHFVRQIFRWKYNRKHNPIRDADNDWEKEIGFGDASSVSFVRQVAQLAKDNMDFLQQRQNVSISASNQAQYTSRLVAPFLLSFWLPQN